MRNTTVTTFTVLHYYPFGTEMHGISSKAFGKLANQYKFNGGVELEESIEMYTTFYRQYDQQLGRFNGVDIMSEATGSINPYQFGLNNPVFFNDPKGDLSDAEWNNVVGKLWASPFGGSWSSATNTVAYFGNEETAELFGTLAALNIKFAFTEDGLYSAGGGQGYIADPTLASIVEKYSQIRLNNDRNFTSIVYGLNRNAIERDLDALARTNAGAFLLSIITVMDYTIAINAWPGSKTGRTTSWWIKPTNPNHLASATVDYDPEGYVADGLYALPQVVLGHELFHAVDAFSFYNGSKNYFWPFDPSDPLYSEAAWGENIHELPKTYLEIRAVMFENLIRHHYNNGYRTEYDGKPFGSYLIQMGNSLKNHKYF